jgi:hypothetical protein
VIAFVPYKPHKNVGIEDGNESWSNSRSGNMGEDATDKNVSKCLCSDKHQQDGP